MGGKILIVDDDLEILRVLRDALESEGHMVRVCDNGNCVMETLREFKPDLLLLDVMLPGADGYTLATRIAGDKTLSWLPIIVLSGLEPSGAMFRSFPQVAAFVPKPFDPGELLETVRKTLSGKK